MACLVANGFVWADAFIEPALAAQLGAAPATQVIPAVMSDWQSGPATLAQVSALRALGITRGVTLRALPVVGAVATTALIRSLAQQPDVVLI